MRRLLAVALVVGSVVLGLVGCGGDGASAEDRADLEDSLGFLDEALGLSDEQIACTAEEVEADLDGDDLARFAAEVRRVDSGEISVEDLAEPDSVILTGAIGTCAAQT